MGSHLLVGALHAGLVEASLGDACAQIVTHKQLGDASEEGEGADMGADPVGDTLGEGSFGVSVTAGAQSGDEDLDVGDLSRVRMGEGESEAGVVYEEFLTRLVVLAHSGVEGIFVGGKAFAELTVAEASGLLL